MKNLFSSKAKNSISGPSNYPVCAGCANNCEDSCGASCTIYCDGVCTDTCDRSCHSTCGAFILF